MISRILFLISMISGSLLVLEYTTMQSSYASYWSDLLDPCEGTKEGSGIEFLRPFYCDETSPSAPSSNVPSYSGSQIPNEGSSTSDEILTDEIRKHNEITNKIEYCGKMNIIENSRIGPATERYYDSYCEVWRYR